MKALRIALLLSVLASPALAQTMNIDLTKLPPDIAAGIVKAQQEKSIKPPTTIEEAEKYAQVGKQVGEAIAATAKALSVESNEFVKTPLGWWVFVFVFWYFLGAKLWHIVGGILFFIVTSTMWWKSLKHFHFASKTLISENSAEKKYEYKTYPWDSKHDAVIGSAAAHIISALVITVVSLFLVF